MRSATGLAIGGFAAAGLAVVSASLGQPSGLDEHAAVRTLSAVHQARASALSVGETPAPAPANLTARMRDDVARQQMAIREAAARDTTERYDSSATDVVINDVQCQTSTCAVTYRLTTEFRRPAGAVSAGAPATMSTATTRHADFTLAPSGTWLLAHDRAHGPSSGIPDPLDAAATPR